MSRLGNEGPEESKDSAGQPAVLTKFFVVVSKRTRHYSPQGMTTACLNYNASMKKAPTGQRSGVFSY
jgi:hypothetical protein